MLHRVRGAAGNKVPCPREYSRADVHRRHCQCVRPLFTASTTPGFYTLELWCLFFFHSRIHLITSQFLWNSPGESGRVSPTFPRLLAIQAARPFEQSQSSHLLHSRQRLAKLSILSLIGSLPLGEEATRFKVTNVSIVSSLIVGTLNSEFHRWAVIDKPFLPDTSSDSTV